MRSISFILGINSSYEQKYELSISDDERTKDQKDGSCWEVLGLFISFIIENIQC